jgi:hypothetical protein
MGEGPKVHVIRVRHYNADIEQPALDMSLARGGHCPVRIDCYQLLAESGGAMIAPHGT